MLAAVDVNSKTTLTWPRQHGFDGSRRQSVFSFDDEFMSIGRDKFHIHCIGAFTAAELILFDLSHFLTEHTSRLLHVTNKDINSQINQHSITDHRKSAVDVCQLTSSHTQQKSADWKNSTAKRICFFLHTMCY